MANSNKQKAVFEKFCNRTCNLLVATRVLEEGVDVRACNLVIRFDPVKTFCDFVQSKGFKFQMLMINYLNRLNRT